MDRYHMAQQYKRPAPLAGHEPLYVEGRFIGRIQGVRMKKYLAVTLFVLLFMSLGSTQTEVAPYKIGAIPIHEYGVEVYKLVHQGCELFVAVGPRDIGGWKK